MIKAYTFAATDAPTSDHMRGLQHVLVFLARKSDREAVVEKSARDRANAATKAQTYRDVIALIEDSNSI